MSCHRKELRGAIGVGAGKFWGMRRNFARILPNLPKKYFKRSDLQKKLFMSIREPLFSNQSMLAAIFAQIFRKFSKVLRDFAWILWDFVRIFIKSKLLGCSFIPCTPASYTSARGPKPWPIGPLRNHCVQRLSCSYSLSAYKKTIGQSGR